MALSERPELPQPVKPKVYLDTSVLSALVDGRTPERQALTREFWRERLPEFDGYISTVVLAEIADTPQQARREEMGGLIARLGVLELDEVAERLAQTYIDEGVFSRRYLDDALHVAMASVSRIPYLASWNFAHLVKVRTRREVSLVNTLQVYESIEIIAPPEL